MPSLIQEDYLKALYRLGYLQKQRVRTTQLAKYLYVQPASVSDMLKKLEENGQINYEKYKGAQLTPLGLAKALEIVRKHRLWEVFLHKKLKFSWHEVHDIAEQLEHVHSKELTSRLDTYLGSPSRDPHGNFIPNQDGHLRNSATQSALSTLRTGDQSVFVGVKNSSAALLKHIDHVGLKLGDKLQIIAYSTYDQSLTIKTSRRKTLFISRQIAENLWILKN